MPKIYPASVFEFKPKSFKQNHLALQRRCSSAAFSVALRQLFHPIEDRNGDKELLSVKSADKKFFRRRSRFAAFGAESRRIQEPPGVSGEGGGIASLRATTRKKTT